MRAYVLEEIGQLHCRDVEMPVLQEGEALVEVMAAGICGSDIPRIFQNGTYHFPTIPGHEFSGRVVDVRSGTDAADASWIGKRVGVFPLIPCRECAPCAKKQFELCRHYNYLGSRCDGGFAEYVAVPVRNLLKLPDGVSYEAAAMLEPMAVAAHAMRRTQPKPGDRVAVCGLGTIGMLLVMFLREAGVERPYVIGNKAFQREKVMELGLPEDVFCDSRTTDPGKWLLQQTDGAGVDVFYECVGRQETIVQGLCVTAPGGSVQLVGNPASDIHFDRDTYWKILRNQLTIRGSWNSSFTGEQEDDWHYVLDRLTAGRIRPECFITHRFPFEELDRGLRIMKDKTEEYLKVIIEK